MGAVGSAGEQVRTYLTLINLGSTVMRYTWKQELPALYYKRERYRTTPIGFDCADGVLLPRETVRETETEIESHACDSICAHSDTKILVLPDQKLRKVHCIVLAVKAVLNVI